MESTLQKVQNTPTFTFLRRIDWGELGVPIAVILLCIIFSFISPNFLTFDNLANVGRQSAALALVAWGMTLIIISAGIDLSAGSVVAFVSVVTATVIKSNGAAAGILAGLVIGTLFGLLNGVLIAKVKLPPFVVTLGTMSIARGAALTYTGGVPVFGLNSKFFAWLGSGNLIGIPVIILIAFLGLVVTYVILRYTKFGVYTYAIGGNETAAYWAGIPVDKYKVLIYTYGGFLTGLGGVLLAARVNSGQPLLGTGLELQAIAAVCIGGTSLFGGQGSIIGTLFGVILIGVLNNALNLLGISSFVQQIIIGITIIIAVLVSILRSRQY
ncbi:MAG: ABC transporter permease [Firmicutes bacterium]|nr:ABC transporter permease [Bacillota bacterium]